MMRARLFLRDRSGAAAAEFALVLPIALLFFLGIIEVGRYVWTINELEKAVQIGTRYAVATDIVATGLVTQDYVGFDGCPNPDPDADPSATYTLLPGANVCREALGTITCEKSGGSLTCGCVASSAGEGSCPEDDSVNEDAFDAIVNRMRVVAPFINAGNVSVRYRGSGIGFADDPAGADVAPIVTVQVEDLGFPLLFLLGRTVPLPTFSYSQTLEDGDGTVAY